MKLDLFDPCYIRARLSPCIILLSPIALTLFLCFEEVFSLVSSSLVICLLLAFVNYIPIVQRSIPSTNMTIVNYAAKFLDPSDTEIDAVSKSRYYTKLAMLDKSFCAFLSHKDSHSIKTYCESAVMFLRNKTRDNHMVYEENINYGFCKNMLLNRPFAICICVFLIVSELIIAQIQFDNIGAIPLGYWVALAINSILLIYWLVLINHKMLEQAGIRYAKALISSIDSIN